jgi:hypothetical protein
LIDLLIRPFKLMRRLFGMKPRRGKEEETNPPSPEDGTN